MGNRHLAIDTATTACSVALFEDNVLIAHSFEEIGRGHAERLIPMIANLPDNGKAENISVNCGPGSFTGIRIGLSAAKALALAWQADILGYQCLSLVAAQALEKMEQKQAVYVVMNGGHGEYFVQNFGADGLAQDTLLSLNSVAALENARSQFFTGSGAEYIAAENPDIASLPCLPDASKILLLSSAIAKIPIKPIYGRSPDAKPSLKLMA